MSKQYVKKLAHLLQTCIIICVILLVSLITGEIKIHKLKNKEPETITKTQIQTQTKEIIIEVEKEPNYTYDELYCMAVVIYNEAGGNTHTNEERELVGYVVLNRVNSDKYPNSIRDVLEQPGQYQGLGKKGVNFAKRSSSDVESEALERAWETAKGVLENRDNIPIPENVIYQAEFKQGSGVYKQIGDTYFCYK